MFNKKPDGNARWSNQKMGPVRLVLLACLAAASVPSEADGARVLAFFGCSSQSHNNFFTALTTELAERGHDLTIVTAYPLKKPPAKNYRQIEAPATKELFSTLNTIETMTESIWDRILKFRKMAEFFLICNNALLLPEVEALKNEKFDLVIVSFLLNDCAIPFARHYGAPLVLIGPAAGSMHFDLGVGNPEPTSYVPNLALPFTDRMTFVQRLINTSVAVFWRFMRWAFYWPVVDAGAREFFGPDTPPVVELLQSTSLVILNSHCSLNYPRPFVPAIIEAGGMQIKSSADPLPKDLQDFLDGAKDGAIYFSMGSILKAKDMRAEKVKAFVEAFAELPQRVIWKWEADTLPGQPKNVKTGAWLPQQAILAHPNVQLFITHGGLLSTQEASYNGVPLVGIPMMGDQSLNVVQSENMGYAVGLPYDIVTKETVLAAVRKILGNPSYREKAKQLQARVLDQPQSPLERAVFWTEYVLRHKGAAHMRSAAVDLNWVQLNLVDVYLTLFALLATPFAIFCCVVKRLICKKKCAGITQNKKNAKKIKKEQ